jgi:Tol biopolymer transport system component
VAGSAPSEFPGGLGLAFSAQDDMGLGLFMLPAGAPDSTRLSPPRVVERDPAVSPDGRSLAYTARDTGGLQLYVRDLPGLTTKARISTEGASLGRWAADGRTLYYQAGSRRCEEDRPVRAPVRAAHFGIHVADAHRCTATERNLLQLALGNEGDPLTV